MSNENEKVVTSKLEATEPHDKNVKLLSPGRMVARRFFRSKLSMIGLIMIIGLFLFCWLGPIIYPVWGETEQDFSGKTEYTYSLITYEENGETHSFYQLVETGKEINSLAKPSKEKSKA